MIFTGSVSGGAAAAAARALLRHEVVRQPPRRGPVGRAARQRRRRARARARRDRDRVPARGGRDSRTRASPAEHVVRVALRALGQQPSAVSGWFNWLRANAAIRLLPRSLLALVAKEVMRGRRRNRCASGSRFVDLSHAIHDGLVTYPGISTPRIGAELTREASRSRYAPGTEFHIGQHRDVDQHGHLSRHAVPPLRRRLRTSRRCRSRRWPICRGWWSSGRAGRARIEPGDLPSPAELAGRAVLFRTGWSRHFGTPVYAERPSVPLGGRGGAAGRGARRARRHRLAQRRRTVR